MEEERTFNLQLFADDTVSLDTLKEQGFSEEDLQGLIQEPTPEPTEPTETPTIEPQQEIIVDGDVTTTTPNTDIVEDVEPHADNLKAALKEERDRRKVLAAELAALKAQQVQSTQQPAQQPQNNPQPINIDEQIEKQADINARGKLKIDNSVDVDDFGWQVENPALYRSYLKATAKEELKLETEHYKQAEVYNINLGFVNELRSQQDFPTLYQFALSELDELPGKKARVIEQAFAKIDKGIGSKEDIETMRTFTAECRSKMNGNQQAPTHGAISMPVSTSPLDKAAGLPKAQNLSGAKTSAMSAAQVESLITQGRIDEIPAEWLAKIDKRLLE